MSISIYLMIAVLYIVLIFWTWNNTKDFEETSQRIIYIIIGIIALSIITLITFSISKIGINYPNKDILKEVRKISLLLFIPINGFLSIPHIASIKTQIGNEEDGKIKRKIIILGIIFIVGIIIETTYLKDFQNGIIQIIKSK